MQDIYQIPTLIILVFGIITSIIGIIRFIQWYETTFPRITIQTTIERNGKLNIEIILTNEGETTARMIDMYIKTWPGASKQSGAIPVNDILPKFQHTVKRTFSYPKESGEYKIEILVIFRRGLLWWISKKSIEIGENIPYSFGSTIIVSR